MKRLVIFLFLLFFSSPLLAVEIWTDKYVSVAGAGTHDCSTALNACTLAEALALPPAAGYRFNIIAGTYALTGDLAFATSGTSLLPIWWRGYHTAIGDLDNFTHARVAGTDMPLISGDNIAYQITAAGAFQIFSNIAITSLCTDLGGAFYLTGGNITVLRCQVSNTQATAAARALSTNTGGQNYLLGCYFSATDTATYTLYITGHTIVHGCTIHGGITGAYANSSVGHFFFNVFDNQVTTGLALNNTTSADIIIGNTFYSAGTDAILQTSIPSTGMCFIANNIFASNGGRAIYQNTGADTFITRAFSNLYYGNGTEGSTGLTGQGYSAGWTEFSTASLAILAGSDPLNNPAADDFSVTSANKALAYPGAFEKESTITGYLDHGAVQRQEPATTGGGNNFVSEVRSHPFWVLTLLTAGVLGVCIKRS